MVNCLESYDVDCKIISAAFVELTACAHKMAPTTATRFTPGRLETRFVPHASPSAGFFSRQHIMPAVSQHPRSRNRALLAFTRARAGDRDAAARARRNLKLVKP